MTEYEQYVIQYLSIVFNDVGLVTISVFVIEPVSCLSPQLHKVSIGSVCDRVTTQKPQLEERLLSPWFFFVFYPYWRNLLFCSEIASDNAN